MTDNTLNLNVLLVKTNPALIALTAILTVLLDKWLSAAQSFGQYLSLFTFVYEFGEGVHWSNVVIKHFVPLVVGACVLFIVLFFFSRAVARSTNPEDMAAEVTPIIEHEIEPSVVAGVVFASLLLSWPAVEFPGLVFAPEQQGGQLIKVAALVLYLISYAFIAVLGLRLAQTWLAVTGKADKYKLIAGGMKQHQWIEAVRPFAVSIGTGALATAVAALVGF